MNRILRLTEAAGWFGAALFAATATAPACDLCAAYSAAQARGELGTGPFFGVAEQFTHFGTLQDDGSEVANPSGQFLDSSVSQVFVGWNLNNHLGLQFNLPVIYRSYQRPDGLGGLERGSTAGLGDVSLLANVVVFRHLAEESTFTWTLLGGVKFPTGSTRRLREELDEPAAPIGPPSAIHGHDLTLGTGSFDGLAGTAVYARWKRTFFEAWLQYAIRSEGDYGYRFANDVTWSGGPGLYAVLGHQDTLGLQVAVSGESKGRDTFRGARAEDTGLTAVYLGPQISLTWRSSLSAHAGVDFPISIDNTALQIVPDYRVRAGLTWRF